jgi:excisionase family DNA binding protein
MKLLTVKEAAEHYRVTTCTIRRWCREGGIITARKVGGTWRIEVS